MDNLVVVPSTSVYKNLESKTSVLLPPPFLGYARGVNIPENSVWGR
jgi:hypothetical protein